MTMEAVIDFIESRRDFLEGVVITGGEPTLWKGLPQFCGQVQNLGLAVKVDTNGSRPDLLAQLIDDGRVDYLAMDLKTAPDLYRPPICPDQTWPEVEQSIALIMGSGIDYEFRTTCLKPFVDEERLRQMVSNIAGAKRYVLQRFRADTLLDHAYFKDADPQLTPDQLEALQAVASHAVQHCRIR